ncbi:hypothetical protein H2199_007443 [Coniosporium tulheliwenetii]|uniref:Uncharacterized protein n=1 Tax=Coniosporium tulheliwenetii TaxID=3383036 RepID=A0ACC2YPI5_9PEZI|nr:hypothetical protein H2199_007443 [Cladosporium sp. JES 115]
MNPSPEKDEPRRESIAEGPTDGYFNRRQHPQDLYVQTPLPALPTQKEIQLLNMRAPVTHKREDIGDANDLGGTSKREILRFVLVWVGIVTTLGLVGLLFPDHRDEAHCAPGGPETPIEYTDPRRTIINVGTGSVSGKYALRDYLSIRTTTGSISITVDPQPADPASPKPAVFEAYAKRGSIRVDFPTRGTIPDREYEVTVHSDTGSISGTFIHGRHTSLSATTGSISAKILPCGAGNASELRTEALTGATTVTLLAPYKDAGTVMGGLESSHKSKSGSMKLVYPQEWEGTVEGRTASGSVGLHGRDLEVVREDKGWVGKHVVAKKGRETVG